MTVDLSFYTRQIDLIDPEKLTQKIAIVGAGGIGSWTALALLKMGCQDVTIFDYDKVEEHNIGSQLYGVGDIGKTKVQAVYDRVQTLTEMSPKVVELEVNESNQWGKLNDFDIVISAVDSIDVRRNLFEYIGGGMGGKWFIDGRMAGNAIELYTIERGNLIDVEFYLKTLFNDSDSRPIACSGRSVIYNTLIISGFIADIVAQLTNDRIPPKEVIIDLLNFSLMT